MRIGIEMLAVQSPGSRGRGVGRYARRFTSALLDRGAGHEFVLYAHEGFPSGQIPSAPNAATATIRIESDRGNGFLHGALTRLAQENPHDLDVLLVLNPFELCPGYAPPARPLDGPRLAAVIFDLIPFLFQEHYLVDPGHTTWMYRRLALLGPYDALLAISESTRTDCLRTLALPDDRVTNIRGAADGDFFVPDHSFPMPARARATLRGLGITRPFVFSLSGIDERKNIRGLLEAFALLPRELHRQHQLVVTCFVRDELERAYRRQADDLEIGDRLVLTGEVSDETLRVLYQRCAAFVFPSRYEGFGLPILEAMRCGAPVVAGNNSSQPEVAGDAALLVNAHDPADIAAKLARLLSDPAAARLLAERARGWARGFSWQQTADRALAALERIGPSSSRHPARRTKPRLAIFSPWPPKGSGIADYATRLIRALKDAYTIDLYHEPGYVPEPALRPDDFSAFDHRLFPRIARIRGYRAVLYQMGNSFYHEFLYEDFLRYGGIVTLHDFLLAGFHWWRAHALGTPEATFRAEVEFGYPDQAVAILPQLPEWAREPGGMQEAFTRRRLYLNRRIFARAEAVVVHSPWCLEQVRREFPDLADRVTVIRLGATPVAITPERRAAVRARFDLPADALILGSFGNLGQSKMNREALDAFAAVRHEFPDSLYLFVGQDWEDGQARARARELGLGDRVRFLGRQPDEDFEELIATIDVGIALRRPPTYGETSAALLDLIRYGVPAIVTDTDTFSDYPDEVVRKVRWESEGPDGLVRAIRELAGDQSRREQLGLSASCFVAAHHDWPLAADRYAELIEQVHAARRGRGVRAIA